MTKLTVSVVIPVFNEEDAIVPCLEALFAQHTPADEIIVVDNASTDATRALLAPYAHRITIIEEKNPGVVFARTTGFNAATGDIIGRIDADSRVTPGWVAELHHIFAHADIVATTGGIHYYDMPLQKVANAIDRRTRRVAMGKKDDAFLLHGTNMALRRSTWEEIRSQLCVRHGVHEDLDIAVHLRKAGYKIYYAPKLIASVSARRLDDTVPEVYRYAMGNIKTYKTHGVTRKRGAVLIAVLLILFHLPLRAIHRGYDPQRRRFSLKDMIFARPLPRKNPLN